MVSNADLHARLRKVEAMASAPSATPGERATARAIAERVRRELATRGAPPMPAGELGTLERLEQLRRLRRAAQEQEASAREALRRCLDEVERLRRVEALSERVVVVEVVGEASAPSWCGAGFSRPGWSR